MKYLKFAQKLFWINIIFFVLYNYCFGWNKVPLSELEQTFDSVSKWGWFLWMFIYLIPLFEIYEDLVKKNDYDKK
tara:strand:+ start:28 stop:252 length:225 start_codon:yes stop_codon:yes gene_type:complete